MKRKINRVIFYVCKFFVGLLVYVDPRVYQYWYNKLLRIQGMSISGEPRFIAKSARFDDFNLIHINDRLVVSMNVHFLTHDYSYTTSLISIGENPKTDVCMNREIYVDENVFIGMNTIILPGTRIGKNVIVGAGSVVRGRIPDNSIVAGNPAIIIGDIREYPKKIRERQDLIFTIDNK